MRSNPHAIHSERLQQISDPTLSKDERAGLRCQLAKELEELGSFETAREAMGELWAGVGTRPVLDELEESTAAEVLLQVGALTGWLGSVKQIEGLQEEAKNLITESITRFEALGDVGKAAEAQTEVAFCYWRQGSYNEARVWLQEALGRLPAGTNNGVRAVALLRLAIVERAAKRFHDALRIHVEAAPLFESIGSHALKGKFHHGFACVLNFLGTAEGRADYIDRALIEYAAASYHFEQAGAAARYQGCIENNLGYLFSTIGKFREAHEHLDRAQALFTGMKDIAHTAGVDETRAKVLLAEGRINEAERLARSAVRILERGGEQSLLAEALTTHGIALARGGNMKTGAQALERLRSGERFDVLIFGYKLPDITGVELIRLTRALAHRQRTPLIMLTDYDVEDDALRAGATLFLRSSGAADSIAETVARLLARKKRTESGA